MNPITAEVLAGHMAQCQAQRESVNHMAAAEAPVAFCPPDRCVVADAPLSATLIDLLYEAATEIGNLTDDGNPVRLRLLKAAFAPASALLQPATLTGLRKALEILERVDHSPNAELERCAPFAIGFAKSAIGYVFRDLGLNPVQCR